MKTNSDIHVLEMRFVEAVSRFGKEVGLMGANEGRIFGWLILSNEPLSQDALMEVTGASRGNVSMGLKLLVNAGFANKVRLKGDRRDYYEANADLWRMTIGTVLAKIGHQIEIVHTELLDILERAKQMRKHAASAGEKRKAGRIAARVEKLVKFSKGGLNLIRSVKRLVERETMVNQ